MKLIATLLAVSLTAGLSSAAQADRDGGYGRRGPGPQGDPVTRIMDRFDTNRDGVLDRQEVAQMRATSQQKKQAKHQQKRQRVFARAIARFDRDRDGRLGPQEVPPQLAHRMTRFDHNGDGWVDAAEVAQPPARRGQR
jgi:EF hand